MSKKPQTPPPAETPAAQPASEQPAAAPEHRQEPAQAVGDAALLRALGETAWLMSRTPGRRHVFMADLDWLVLPPLYLGQAKVFNNEAGNPAVYISWASVNDEVNERLKAGVERLQPGDWRSGPHPWIIDVVAPFGSGELVAAEVVNKIFGGKPVPVLAFGGKIVGDGE